MEKIYGVSLVRFDNKFILKASNGKLYSDWDAKQDYREALDIKKLKEYNLQFDDN